MNPKTPHNPASLKTVLKILKKRFPHKGAMEVGSPYENLAAVILSARTRDEQVLKLLPDFFKAFPSPERLSEASLKEIESKINSIGMFRNKAKSLKKMSSELAGRFAGRVPDTMEELTSLSGVGRKTASVILVASFGQSAIAVDTHVHRVTNRLGWVKTKTPAKTEEALLAMIPAKDQPDVNKVFVKLGRYICIPGKPRCFMCPIRDHCAFSKKNLAVPKDAQKIKETITLREKELEVLRKNAV